MSLQTQVSYRRGDFHLRFELGFPAGGVTALLGPSGSGKSTLLRLIAGLERPQAGRIRHGDTLWFDSDRAIHLPPRRRRVGFVFQDYALFDHLTVTANVGYGLPRAQRAVAVGRWLERLDLSACARRYPHQLSGGQRQRVALARALAPKPEVLLLDEPFSAVDGPLRQTLRAELQQVLAGAARSVVLVSHDLEDARHLADQVGVLVDGRLERFGSTVEVFAHPGSGAAARVLGWCNLLAVQSSAGPHVTGAWGEVTLDCTPPAGTAWLGVRPEHLRVDRPGRVGLSARIDRIIECGAVRSIQCRLADDSRVEVHRPWDEPLPAPGEAVTLVPLGAGLQALPESAALHHEAPHPGGAAAELSPADGRTPLPVRQRLAG